MTLMSENPFIPDPPELSIAGEFGLIKQWEEFVVCLGKHEREAAYGRARMVLKAEMENLIINHGWTLHVSTARNFFHISKATPFRTLHIRLPFEFSSFSEENELHLVFKPAIKRLSATKIDLFISEEEPPLANIFYIFQVIAPGFMMINYSYNYDGYGDVLWEMVLPPKKWVEERKDILAQILGSYQKYDLIHMALGDYYPLKPSYHPSRRTRPEVFWQNHQDVKFQPCLPNSLVIGESYTA